MEQVSQIYSLPENLYCKGSPVVVTSGIMVRENVRKSAAVLFNLRKIRDVEFSSLEIVLKGINSAGQETGEVTRCVYETEGITRDQIIGAKQYNFFSDPDTWYCEIEEIIVYADGNCQVIEGNNLKPLPKMRSVSDMIYDKGLQTEYWRERKTYFAVTEYKDLWICPCTGINHTDETVCQKCGERLDILKGSLDVENLRKSKDVYEKNIKSQPIDLSATAEAEKSDKSLSILTNLFKFVAVFLLTVGITLPCCTQIIANVENRKTIAEIVEKISQSINPQSSPAGTGNDANTRGPVVEESAEPSLAVAEVILAKKGDNNETVLQAQTMLSALGYLETKPDGIFGDNTLNAMIAFQNDYGLSNDGLLTDSTFEVLKKEVVKILESDIK